jgi:hypothetical protein
MARPGGLYHKLVEVQAFGFAGELDDRPRVSA